MWQNEIKLGLYSITAVGALRWINGKFPVGLFILESAMQVIVASGTSVNLFGISVKVTGETYDSLKLIVSEYTTVSKIIRDVMDILGKKDEPGCYRLGVTLAGEEDFHYLNSEHNFGALRYIDAKEFVFIELN